jgi:hypothetical protein
MDSQNTPIEIKQKMTISTLVKIGTIAATSTGMIADAPMAPKTSSATTKPSELMQKYFKRRPEA